MILIDTSAWVEYFRATGSIAAVEVRRLLSEEAARIAMCEPIAMEILSGALDDNTHTTLERLVNGLPSLNVETRLTFVLPRVSIAPPGAPAKRFEASTTAS